MVKQIRFCALPFFFVGVRLVIGQEFPGSFRQHMFRMAKGDEMRSVLGSVELPVAAKVCTSEATQPPWFGEPFHDFLCKSMFI